MGVTRQVGARQLQRSAAEPDPPRAPLASASGFSIGSIGALALLGLLASGAGGCRRERLQVQPTVPYERSASARANAAAEPVPAANGEGAPAAEPAAAVRDPLRVGETLLLYRRGERPCEVLMAGTTGLATGPCGARLARKLYPSEARRSWLAELATRLAPFEVETASEELELHGRGVEPAGELDRRRLLEWTRRLVQETAGVPGSQALGMALSWHRQSGLVGACENLTVSLTGETRATSCGDHRVDAHAELSPADLARLYTWYDGLAPFQEYQAAGGGRAEEGQSRRVIFAGAGGAQHDAATVDAMAGFASRVYVETAAEALRREEERRQAAEAQRRAGAAAAAGGLPPGVVAQAPRSAPGGGSPPAGDAGSPAAVAETGGAVPEALGEQATPAGGSETSESTAAAPAPARRTPAPIERQYDDAPPPDDTSAEEASPEDAPPADDDPGVDTR